MTQLPVRFDDSPQASLSQTLSAVSSSQATGAFILLIAGVGINAVLSALLIDPPSNSGSILRGPLYASTMITKLSHTLTSLKTSAKNLPSAMALSGTDLPISTSVPPMEMPPLNILQPHQNAQIPPCQSMSPGVPQPPLPNNSPSPLLVPLPILSTKNNYFGPPTPQGLPPPCWAPGPPPGNTGQPPSGGPPNRGPPGGWGPVMDNFPPQCGNGNNYYYLLLLL
ncbi:hypothetical protein H2248_000607 [Termitomyces sp. 'cryptogamus']|nr:hypothetical protein H2248_000607 [Termitomyces sp. 'cryptogamus']